MARPGTKLDMIGSEANINKNSPLDMIPDAFAGGTVQFIGSEAMMDRSNDPLGDFSGRYAKNVRSGGRTQMIGSEADLKTKSSFAGWNSYDTPIARQSQASQSSDSDYPAPGRKSSR